MNNNKQLETLPCRFCHADTFQILNLGDLPFANALSINTSDPVDVFPTALHICSNCSTAQLSYCSDLNVLYSDYVYITPESGMLSEHYQRTIDYLLQQNYFNKDSNVLEIGSNIGRFLSHLQPYVNSVLGVDPAKNIVKMANDEGVNTINEFFNAETAKEIAQTHGSMDLMVARHCFAHNEQPWLMLEGVAELLSEDGIFVIENAYFPDTIDKREFDQVYHEHMYYYNLRAIKQVAEKYGFKLIDCLHSSIHGGTMLYIVKRESAKDALSNTALSYLKLEKAMHQNDYYLPFTKAIERNKTELQNLLQSLKAEDKTIHVYGASAKSTTLLNYFDINSDIIPYAVDSTITKHGKYIPLTHIKIISEEEAQHNFPDYYLLTIWNYKDEIIRKVRESGNHKSLFIIPHPEVEVIES